MEIFAAGAAIEGGLSDALTCAALIPRCWLNSMKLSVLRSTKRGEKKRAFFSEFEGKRKTKALYSPEVAGDPIFGIGMLLADPPLLVGYMFRWFRPLTRFAASE